MHKSVRHKASLPGMDVVSITSNRSFPRHTHDEFGLGFISDGGQQSWSGRGLVEAETGDVITVNPGELHDGIAHDGQARSWHMIYLTPQALAEWLGDAPGVIEFKQPVLGKSRANQVVTQAVASVVGNATETGQIEEALLISFGALKGQFVQADPTVRRSKAVHQMLTQIHDDVSGPLSLSDLSAEVGLSRFQTLRLFAKEVGATPHAYLTQQRVKSVKALIQAGTSLAEASIACGFADQSHMTRAFVRQYGVTPGKYRSVPRT